MHHLSGGHVTEAKALGDVGQRTTLHRRLPENLPLFERELPEHAVDKVAVGHRALDIARGVRLRSERDQRLPEPRSATKDVETVIPGDGQQPGARLRRWGPRVQRVRGDHEDVLCGIGGVLGISQQAGAETNHSQVIRLVDFGQPLAERALQRVRPERPNRDRQEGEQCSESKKSSIHDAL